MKKKQRFNPPPPMSPCMYFHDCIAPTITADFPIFTTKSYFKLIMVITNHVGRKKSILEAPAVFRKSGGELCGL